MADSAMDEVTPAARAQRWRRYLEQFHHDRAGITTDTLGTARSGDLDPYQWALQPLGRPERLIDVACGDGPVHDRLFKSEWVGLDTSRSELQRAKDNGAGPLLQADAANLPLATGSAPAVICSMALMITRPLATVVAEITRILTPDGVAVALIPGGRALTVGDLWSYTNLMITLRRSHLAYPNDWRLSRLRSCTARAGLHIVADQRRRFELPLADLEAAQRFVASLYLPGVAASRQQKATTCLTRRTPTSIGIPLRRITLRPAPARILS